MRNYEEPIVQILVLSIDDVIRVSGVNGSDNDGAWDSGWDRQ
jgi:hypothetical protein